MEFVDLEYRRRLPPELLTEMHKCLPLDKAIYVLVNVSKTFVINNSSRMHRTIQRIKTSLKEHIDTLVEAEEQIDDEEGENNPEELVLGNKIEWKPQMDALLRYGSWLTSTRKFYCHRVIGEIPGNFVGKLLLHLANSSSTQMMLQIANIYFDRLPMPAFLKPLLNEKQFRFGGGFVFESVELKADDGQTMHIHDGDMFYNKLRLFVMNKMDRKMRFQIWMNLDSSKEFIRRLEFSQWKMQSQEDVNKFVQKFCNLFEEKDGNILEAKKNISSNPNLDLFLRRGAKFTQFRHIKIKHYKCPNDYVDFLIDFISNAKHPEEFLESIDFDLFKKCSDSIKKLWEICQKGIPKGGKFVQFGMHILSGKITKLEKRSWDDYDFPRVFAEYSLEFTLANLPTNGKYLFDICVEFGNGLKQIVGIKIQRRKNDDEIVESNCNEQIEKQLGKKAAANDDDGKEEDDDGYMSTCSSKIIKK